jgi:hypothetical protein
MSPNRADNLSFLLKLTVCCSDNPHMVHEIWFADATRGGEAHPTEPLSFSRWLRSRSDNGILVTQDRKRAESFFFPRALKT